MTDTIFSEGLDGIGPKYVQLSQMIRDRIASGQLAAGSRLPPVRELAWQLGITPGTVARAYSALTDAGALRAEVGRGTFVADAASDPLMDRGPIYAPVPWVSDEGSDAGRISLVSPRLPDLGQVAWLRAAFGRLSERPPSHLLDYPTSKAFTPARLAALRWLEGAILGPIDEQDVVLTHGGQSGISLVLQAVLKGRAPHVAVEDLSYPGFRRAAQLLRADVMGVPMDAQGIVPDSLDQIARRHEIQVLCTSPEIHNPTGIVTPTERREEIARVAIARGFHVLEDDCYRLGQPNGPSYRALLPEQGWHVSSLSKALTPALRIGFAVAPQAHRTALRRAAEYGFFGLARPLADVAEDILSRDETYALMDRLRLAVGDYVREAVNILGGYELSWRPDVPFLWLTLPQGWRAAAFLREAEAQGIQMRSGEDFVLRDAVAPHAVRMAINGQVPLPVFADAMQRLRRLLDNPTEVIEV